MSLWSGVSVYSFSRVDERVAHWLRVIHSQGGSIPPHPPVPPMPLHVGLLASMFWLSCLPGGSSLFFHQLYLQLALRRPTADLTTSPLSVINIWTRGKTKQTMGHIVERDMSSQTGTFIFMNRFSVTWHFLSAEMVKVCRGPFETLHSGGLIRTQIS